VIYRWFKSSRAVHGQTFIGGLDGDSKQHSLPPPPHPPLFPFSFPTKKKKGTKTPFLKDRDGGKKNGFYL